MDKCVTVELKDNTPWINPVGGYGDMLMVAGVLKQVHDKTPEKQFNLIRRSRYTHFLGKHEAIRKVGFPDKGDKILSVNYWSMEKLGAGNQRAYQVLARAFGLQTPVEEILYLPGEEEADPLFIDFLPLKEINVLIAPATDSPRKAMKPSLWHQLVDQLKREDIFVMQTGLFEEIHIKNAYSVQGQTTPAQLVNLLKEIDLVITADNFIMHAAHMVGIPAVVIWGPTQCEVYGYPEQIHFQNNLTCELTGGESCIVSAENQNGELYGTSCPMGDLHCMDQTNINDVYLAAKKLLAKTRKRVK